MGKALELKGQKFGKLLVLEKTNEKTSNGSIKWKCLCDCGKEVLVPGPHLKSGHTTSCGCYQKGEEIKEKRRRKIKDISNQKFGKLTALYILPRENDKEKIKWHCICDCGNEVDVLSSSLISGLTKSCGCLKHKQNPLEDLKGQRFGKLTAIKPTDKRINRAVVWECKCDCGNIAYVIRPHLLNGYVSSCGCLNKSKGELKIEEILKKLNISFEKQKTFSSCIFPDTKYKAYFDFYLPNENILIEYDGEQHFIAKEYFGGEEELNKRKEKDEFKNQWCKDNNYSLIRISYKNYDYLNEQYLLERIKKNE